MRGLYNVTEMLEGKCPQCGQCYYGMALANPRYQTCNKCGAGLEIKDGDKIIKGFSPFSADNISIKAKPKTSREDEIRNS
jgi:uncharacterized protein (DUF983 family)